MYEAISSMRRILINDINVSSSVTVGNIRVGFQRQVDSYPCVAFYRIGGSSVGRFGYKTAVGGSKDRTEDVMLQVDLFHLGSMEDLELLDDYVIKAVMSGARPGESFTLFGNTGGFDFNYDCFRSIQTWTYSRIVSD